MNGSSPHASLLSTLESVLPVGVARARADGSIVEQSDGFAALLAGSGDRIESRVAAADRDAVAAALATIAAGVPERVLEVRGENGDSPRSLEVVLRRVDDPAVPCAVVVRDRSEIASLERRLILSERLRLIGGMTLGCAHELGNLLEVAAQIAGGRSTQGDEDLALLRRALDDALRLARRLRDFARHDEPRAPAEPVDVRRVLAEALEFTRVRWQREAVAAGISIDVDADLLPAGTVLGSASRLRHAVANLIANAVDAMPEGGRLRVGCRQEAAEAIIEIADTGVGIPPEIQTRIFEPFFSTKGERGLGLGLSVVSDAVARHGGRLQALSLPNSGSRFEIRLPILSQPIPAAPVRTSPAPLEPIAASRILLVDDNHAVRRLVARTLRSDGHEVVECASAEEADALPIRPGDFDLLLIDVSLPGRSGLELIRSLRARGHHAPVLLVTAWGLDIGSLEAVRVLHKPFGPDALRRAVAEIRRGSS